MPPRSKIHVPRVLLQSGLSSVATRDTAAEVAADGLLNTSVFDWRGCETSLMAVTDHEGITEEIRFAAKQVFLALVGDGMTYRDYCSKTIFKPEQISDDVRAAMGYFHLRFERSPELADDLRLGNGDLLLLRMDALISQQITRELAAEPQRTAS